MSEETYQQITGEEPISSDDLIFQIGEKEVDLLRKRIAIKNLTKR